MKKLLVTGASGFLGWNLCQEASAKWEVFGAYYSHAVKIAGVTLSQVDLREYEQLKELFSAIKPDAVIHSAAASKPNYCQQNPQESYEINVTASVNIAKLCAEYQIPCAFTSTDLVFDGQGSFYQESDRVCPICIYGEQKVLAEQKMLSVYPKVSICRMPLMFGLPSPVANSFLQGFISSLKAGQELNLFVDEFRTPASAIAAAQGLLLAIEKQVSGILHLGGRERVSRYEFGLLLAEVMQLPKELIRSGKQSDIVMIAPRSPDTSLNSNKAFALGYNPLPLKEELIKIYRQIS
ncbi:dTDP-4-dehydrorhamnose reductase [Xenococcus sp. PCC 7305]|uniref:SDR family oxidoreductase n=1 Tax=Xenococcus sp. PCC 7305 TaxID=102125 RepID=UPI0002AC0E96|nr:NAD(P)-dependent oxidoreductase [Xenococcus sp. PCC 7305]ELS04560.1 dTDP-4-dehydrorhamnose reductase [Xenococcus sp. PCC 7305]